MADDVQTSEVDPQRIKLEPYQAAYSLDLPINEGAGEPREFRLAVGVDFGAVPPGQTIMLVDTGGRVLLPQAESSQPTVDSVARAYRGKDALERWYTPQDMAALCWRWLLRSGLLVDKMPSCAGASLRVLEPCVGGGAWVHGLEAASPAALGLRRFWTVCDVDSEALSVLDLGGLTYEAIYGDITGPKIRAHSFDVAISNPPNSKALEVIQACMAVVDHGGVVAMLMPASWMAARRRREWLRLNPPRVVALAPWRPSFGGPAAEVQGTGDGSPTQEYALHVWVVGDPSGVEWRATWIEDGAQGGEVDSGEE
jgi:hypothetical protein